MQFMVLLQPGQHKLSLFQGVLIREVSLFQGVLIREGPYFRVS